MKLLTSLFLFALLSVSFVANADTSVRGYYRSDGTYVQPHYRSSPNQYRYDNYSSQGNTNPYSGEKGYKQHEYTTPPAYNKGYGGYGNSYGNGKYNLYND